MPAKAAGCARTIAPIALVGLLLAGCVSPPPVGSADGFSAGRGIGTYRIGSPYEIKGVWYYPAIDYNYDKTGIASWYGEEFEGRLTANGEIFDLNDLTAAHTTLPMPSIVQVTNLENGRSLQLRVNDRGPFVGGRLIDVSRRSAQLLGFEKQGTTLVEVKILKDESVAAAEEAMHGSGRILVAEAAGAAAAALPGSARPAYFPASAPPPVARPVIPPPRRVAIETRPAPPRQPRAAPPPQMAINEMPPPLPPQPSPAPPPSRMAPPPRSLFALIAAAEAAELPPARGPRRAPKIVATSTTVSETPSSPSRVAAAPGGPAARLYVQAGAFSRRGNAQQVQYQIARLGSAQVTSASVNGVAMYRVRIGPLRSREQADRLLARVVDSGYRGARIVGD